MHVIACLFLIAVVLLQQGKGQDLASAFGGGGTQTAFGPRGSATVLSRATTILAGALHGDEPGAVDRAAATRAASSTRCRAARPERRADGRVPATTARARLRAGRGAGGAAPRPGSPARGSRPPSPAPAASPREPVAAQFPAGRLRGRRLRRQRRARP